MSFTITKRTFGFAITIAVIGSSCAVSIAQANPASTCRSNQELEKDMSAVKSQIRAAKQAASRIVPVRPALQYEKLTESEMKSMSPEQREERFLGNAIDRITGSLKVMNAGGDVYGVAEDLFGSQAARNGVYVLRRPSASSNPNAPAAASNSCTTNCRDMALNIRQLYASEGKSPAEAAAALSAYKLANTPASGVEFCTPRSKDCGNPKAFTTESDPKPMKLDEPYLVNETQDTPFPFSNIRSQSLYQVTRVKICGKDSYLLTSFLTGKDASYDHSTLIALVTEMNGKTVVVGEFQGYVDADRGPVPPIFLQFQETATGKVSGMYNTQAALIGSSEKVNKLGRVSVPAQGQGLPVAVGSGASSTGSNGGSGARGKTQLVR